LAHQELEILGMLRADEVLRAQDLRGVMLAELLFGESKSPTEMINKIRQVIRANRYWISDKQINDIYRRSMTSNIYWLLLKNEAQLAGISIPNNDAGEMLARIIPQIFKGQKYSQQMGLLVNRYRIPEAHILSTFGKLLAVYQYAQLICSNEDITSSQIRHLASWENETINVEFVKLDAGYWIHDTRRASNIEHQEPNDEEIQQHFNKYKRFFTGEVTEDNPYGFGYKLPDRVQLEYIAFKLNDISTTVTPPTTAECEQYYQKHMEQFVESVPQDPNDPNSPSVEQTRSFSEVADVISRRILQDKINSKAEGIVQEAQTLTETQEPGVGDLGSAVSSEPRIPNPEGQTYESAAKQLANKHKIKIYAGQTGLLSALDMETDKYLRRLYTLGNARNMVRLTQTIFSLEQFQADTSTSSRSLDVQRPKLYENIGPIKDSLGEIMAVVRIIKAEKASEPQSLDARISKRTLRLDDNEAGTDNTQNVYSVKEKVAEDVNKLAAIQEGRLENKAKEFIGIATKDGWNTTIDKFNQLYRQVRLGGDPNSVGQQSNAPLLAFAKKQGGENEPNAFKLESLTALRRISGETLAALAIQSSNTPGQRQFVPEVKKWLTADEVKIESQLIDRFYSLVPQDSNTVKTLPVTLEFKPYMSLYIIKDISIKRLGQDEYEKIKPKQLFTEDHINSQSLAPVHFNPENILKRMKFRPAKKEKPASGETDSNSSDGSEKAS
jgi:hypothetical protein